MELYNRIAHFIVFWFHESMVQATQKASIKFMVAITQTQVREQLAKLLSEKFEGSLVYVAKDGIEVLQKFKFDYPDVLILDDSLTGRSSEQIVASLYNKDSKKIEKEIQTIVLSEGGKEEAFADFSATGQLQVISAQKGMDALIAALYGSISRIQPQNKDFNMRFIGKGEVLLKEGEKGDRLYILKKGKLTAQVGTGVTKIVLGHVSPGEFVGEMAYINGEPRAATVIADEDSELVEFKTDAFEKIVLLKPSWMKILLKTLSSRIKLLNIFKSKGSGKN